MLKSKAIVLKEIRYKDTSKILTIYTKEYGKISVMASGAYRAKSQLIATTQVFSYSEYHLNKGKGGGILYLNQADLINSFYTIREKMERVTYGYYMLELVEKSLPEEQENKTIFLLLEKGLRVLSRLNENFLQFIIAYELKFVSFLGYKPNIERCVSCNNSKSDNIKFSISQGGIICSNCYNIDPFALYLNKEIYETMHKLLYIPLERTDEIKSSKDSIDKLHGIMVKYILRNIDRKRFNSLKLMEDFNIEIQD